MAEAKYRYEDKERLIVLVKSCQAHRDRQDACRATWAGELSRNNIPIWFIEGGHDRTRTENCWLLLNCADGYSDLSFKLRDALAFFLQHDPFDRVFICDDDTFVHWRRWLDFDPSGKFAVGLHTPKIPWIHGGAGWFMDRSACQLYVDGVKRRCSWDDKLASEIFTRAGWAVETRPELFAQWDERVGPDNQLITSHGVKPAEMLTLFRDTYELQALHDVVP